jgi:hypothetical protein
MPRETDNFIYLQRDVSVTRTDLLPARVLWINGAMVAAEVDVVTFPDAAGKKLSILFEDGRRFVTQEAVVEGVIDREAADERSDDELSRMDFDQDSRAVVVVLKRVSDPVLAESRECYRVRTVPLNVTVRFVSCLECDLTDISQTGFAVLSDEAFEAKSVVEASLPDKDGCLIEGHVRVQSVRQLRNGRYRYGVAVFGRGMQTACAWLATELQRQMIRRSVTVRSS